VNKRIVGVSTQGRADYDHNGGQYVTKFYVRYLDTSGTWNWVANRRLFDGPQSNDDTSKFDALFPEPVTAQAIIIYPYSWVHHPSMRADVLVQQGASRCAGSNRVIDNSAVSNEWSTELQSSADTCAERVAVKIDLGQMRTVNTAKMYMYAGDARSYCGHRLDLSADGINWTTMFDQGDTIVQTSASGNYYSFDQTVATYARFWSSHSNYNLGIHLLDVSLWWN
jgi:hypothetical protein